MNLATGYSLAAGIPWAIETTRGLVDGEGFGEASISALPAAAGAVIGLGPMAKVIPYPLSSVAGAALGALGGDMIGDRYFSKPKPTEEEITRLINNHIGMRG